MWPGAGIALADGHYLVRWPLVAVLAGVPCFLVGVALGATHPGEVYSYSVLVIAVFGLIGQFGAAFGLWATTGYAFGDLVLHVPATVYVAEEERLRVVVLPMLLSYGVLALFTVVAPLTVLGVRMMVLGATWLPRPAVRWVECAAAVLTAGLAAYTWARTAPMLLRPIFVWSGSVPTVDAVAPLQQRAWLLVVVVGATAAARVLLDRWALTGRAATFSQILWAGLGVEVAKGPRSGALGLVLVLVGAIGATFLLAGLISGYVQATAVFLFFVSLLAVRRLLLVRAPQAVAVLMKVPFLIRLAAGVWVGYLVGKVVISYFWTRTETFLPVLASACAAIAVITLLTLPPPGNPYRELPRPRSRHGV